MRAASGYLAALCLLAVACGGSARSTKTAGGDWLLETSCAAPEDCVATARHECPDGYDVVESGSRVAEERGLRGRVVECAMQFRCTGGGAVGLPDCTRDFAGDEDGTKRAKDGLEAELSGGVLQSSFEPYHFQGRSVVDSAALFTTDLAVRYWRPSWYIGGILAYGASMSAEFAPGTPPFTQQHGVDLETFAIDAGAQLHAGAWFLRPGAVLGLHHALVTTGSGACYQVGQAGDFPCDLGTTADRAFVQPRFSASAPITGALYAGAYAGLDVVFADPPAVGETFALTIGLRTPE